MRISETALSDTAFCIGVDAVQTIGTQLIMLRHLNPVAQPPARVVVLGSSGFVGGALVERLRQSGIATLPVDRAKVDLLDADAAGALADLLKSSDVVVAVAAMAPVKNSQMLADNMRLVATIIDALDKVNVAHVVNISSDAIYADSPLPLTEMSPMAPTSLHGAMHLARELAFGAEVNAPLANLRPTLIYGASDPHNGYGPNRFRRLAQEGNDIVLFGNGEERRDHVCVDDVAEIIMRVVLHRSVGELNVVTGEVHSFREIANATAKIAGNAHAIKTTPRVGPMPHNGYRPFDNAACKQAFPDFRFTPLLEGLGKAALH
jgi:UDP-glucose 4-epimerase